MTRLKHLALPRGVLAAVQAADQEPNIVVIWGDDIGVHNTIAYSHGIVG
jgi:hypothetical protein